MGKKMIRPFSCVIIEFFGATNLYKKLMNTNRVKTQSKEQGALK